MSNLITFGRYEGKSMEWLFFNAPWYAEWMYEHGIHRQRHNCTSAEEEHFDELVRRASGLKGICRWCRARRLTRLGVSSLLAGGPDHVGFYCEECTYPEQAVTFYGAPSFFVEYENIHLQTQLRVPKYIQRRYIDNGSLTQAKMEAFFRSDEYFAHATPGFFNKATVATLSG